MRDAHVGDLQHAILEVLWDREEATVAEVHRQLEPERGLALTTIATMLTKMERRGLVSHSRDGRRYVYRPRVSRKTVRRSMVTELTDRLFAGDPTELVAHLLREHEIDSTELDELHRRVEAASPPTDDEE